MRWRSWSMAASPAPCRPPNWRPTKSCASVFSGVRQGTDESDAADEAELAAPEPPRWFQVRRSKEGLAESGPSEAPIPASPSRRPPNRWGVTAAAGDGEGAAVADEAAHTADVAAESPTLQIPVAAGLARSAYVIGTFDTKGRELTFIRACLERLGVRTVTVDVSSSGKPSSATSARSKWRGIIRAARPPCSPATAARRWRRWPRRFERFIATRRDIGGVIGAGGSGATALVTAGDARAAGRPAQADGLDGRLRRREALCRRHRHLHDVFGHRRVRAQPHLRAGAHQRRACARRHDRAAAARTHRTAKPRHRPHHVRRDDAVRAGGGTAAARPTTTASSSTPPGPAGVRWRSWSTPACSPASSTPPRPRSPICHAAA